MELYHSTIKAKLDEILKSHAIEPGKESPEDGAFIFEMMTLGQYANASQNHVYLWRNVSAAEECAKFISSRANFKYSHEERQPVVIKVGVSNVFRLGPDGASKGLKHLGPIPERQFLDINFL